MPTETLTERLSVLERRIADSGKDATPADRARFAEQLCEAIVEASQGAFQRIDGATAAREERVAQLGVDDDEPVVWDGASGYWFPRVKVEKFLANGASDSVAAFGQLVVGLARPPLDDAELRREMAEADARACDELLALMTACRATSRPQPNDVHELYRRLGYWSNYEHAIAWSLEQSGLKASDLLPFLSAPASGRGYERKDPGRAAAVIIGDYLAAGERPGTALWTTARDALSGDKLQHANAAWLLTYLAAQASDWAAIDRLYHELNQPGKLASLESLAYRDELPAEPLTELLRGALRAKGALPGAALRALSNIPEPGPLLDDLLDLLERGKPAVIEAVLNRMRDSSYAMGHGRLPYDPRLPEALPRIATHLASQPGKQKVTKVQIAAAYALRGLSFLAEKRGDEELAAQVVAHQAEYYDIH